jgi:hypothetical protein
MCESSAVVELALPIQLAEPIQWQAGAASVEPTTAHLAWSSQNSAAVLLKPDEQETTPDNLVHAADAGVQVVRTLPLAAALLLGAAADGTSFLK